MGLKGQPKTGGRKSGTTNKSSLPLKLPTVLEILNEQDCNPIRNLAILAKHQDPQIQVQANRELCKYIYPTIRTIEVKADVSHKLDPSQAEGLVNELYVLIGHLQTKA